MRLASILLVCVLLTTSVISGTFAKYVTAATANDSARVAKWGITMSNGDDMFKANYVDTVVAANGTDKIVAPGTDGSTTYEVDGTPEVDYKITFEGTKLDNEMYLGEGTYTYAGTNVEYVGMNATLTQKYYPLDWRVTIKSTEGSVSGGWVANVPQVFTTLGEAMTALAGASVTYNANTPCDLVVLIQWEWDYDASSGFIAEATCASNNVHDTILGDLVPTENANLTASAGADFSLNVGYTVKMTATQID